MLTEVYENGDEARKGRLSILKRIKEKGKGKSKDVESPERSVSEPPRPCGEDQQPIHWPSQFLTEDLPHAHIWTYGYNADVIGGLFKANNKNSISQHGRDLANKLERDIENDAVHESEICQHRTKLIIFLGTPHRGSDSAEWGKIAANLVQLGFQDSNKKILRSLEVNSEILEIIHRDFVTIVHEKKIKIHSFQESRPITGIKGLEGKVVSDFSSRLDLPKELETVETIDADHIRMTKYETREDAGYYAVSGVIRKFCRENNSGGTPVAAM
ncbi:hypothetical protein SLS56_000742 [Neofusicoccum ribis]|uniref:Uncharacterized protein n=1 Tax=Neofusicoccum ribis TaxID=45134 RepID=A0ABR3TBZ1_9PEZI